MLLNEKYKEFAVAVILFFTVLFLEIIFFRSMIFNPDNLIGDSWQDGRLVSLIMEHWYKVIFYNEPLRDLSMFYPIRNTLGYSDAMFLVSIPYVFLRAIGFQWLTAFQMTMILTHFFGGLCLAWLLRRELKLPLFACIIGIIIGNFGLGYFIKLIHVQFIATSLVPLLFIFIKKFFDYLNPDSKKKRMLFGMLTILLFSGILITSFYVAFYTAFFLLIVFIIMIVYNLKNNLTNVEKIKNIILSNKYEAISYFLIMAASLIPFLYIYIPVLREMGTRSWSDVYYQLPYWFHFFNFAPLAGIINLRGVTLELLYGYSMITAVILIVACISYIKKYYSNDIFNRDYNFYITTSFSLAIVVISLLMVRVNIFNRDLSLWYFVYVLIPSASAIRAPFRFNQFLLLPAGILVAIYLANYIKYNKNHVIRYFVIWSILIGIIFINNQTDFSITRWTKSGMNDYLERVSAPPESLESFFLINNVNSGWRHHMDAWSIAHRFNIRTINGYSGQFPRNWWPLADIGTHRNYHSLSNWIRYHNLNNVYLYDYINDTWIRYSQEAIEQLLFRDVHPLSLGETVYLANARSVYQFNGWSFPENWGTWTETEQTSFGMYVANNDDLFFILDIQNISHRDPIDVYINNNFIGSFLFEIGTNGIFIPGELFPENRIIIRFQLYNVKTPEELGIAPDGRRLGVGVRSFRLESAVN